MIVKAITLQASALVLMSAALTYGVYQLKPTHPPVMDLPSEAPADSNLRPTPMRLNAAFPKKPLVTSTDESLISETNVPQELNYISTLNDLLLDYFTTDFDVALQDKWQDALLVGSPYLAVLASYLKLDKLYGINLYVEQDREITRDFMLNTDFETVPSFFTVIDLYAQDFWPMSVIQQAKSNSHTPKILLNNYDRDFVIKIERQHLGTSLAPLAFGIERLLRYHLSETVRASSGLRTYRRKNNIDNVVNAINQQQAQAAPLFIFYNEVLKGNWQEAAQYLQTTKNLNTHTYQFLYELIAANNPLALINSVNYEQYTEQQAWWDAFLGYQLCISKFSHKRADINQRLSITLPCQTDKLAGISILQKTVSDDLFMRYWNTVLNANNPSIVDREKFLLSLTADEKVALFNSTAHDLFDYLARKERLKIIRSPATLQRIEINYKNWRIGNGLTLNDSFYNYFLLHHWFGRDRHSLSSLLNSPEVSIIATLSDPIKTYLAEDLLIHIESGVINQGNWTQLSTLIPFVPKADLHVLSAFSELTGWPDLTELAPDRSTPERHRDKAFEILFTSSVFEKLDSANQFDDFLRIAEAHMHDFKNRYADTQMAKEINKAFSDDGTLTAHAMRGLKRTWQVAYPNQSTQSETTDSPG